MKHAFVGASSYIPGGGPGFGTASGGGGGGRLRKFPCCFFGVGGEGG